MLIRATQAFLIVMCNVCVWFAFLSAFGEGEYAIRSSNEGVATPTSFVAPSRLFGIAAIVCLLALGAITPRVRVLLTFGALAILYPFARMAIGEQRDWIGYMKLYILMYGVAAAIVIFAFFVRRTIRI